MMKILFMQSAKNNYNPYSSVIIENLCLKELKYDKNYKNVSLKNHFHTEYEIHIISKGTQIYEISGKTYSVEKDEFIVIPPEVEHRMVNASNDLKKYSLMFSIDGASCGIHKKTVNRILKESLYFIAYEYELSLPHSSTIIKNRVFELPILIFRDLGYFPNSVSPEKTDINSKVFLAEKFICDNLLSSLSVSDVADYCHLGVRQLTRIFSEFKGVSPAKYIADKRMSKISEYLKTTDIPMGELSRMFSFRNEYYFNTSFKKHFGIPPMTYRKMYR